MPCTKMQFKHGLLLTKTGWVQTLCCMIQGQPANKMQTVHKCQAHFCSPQSANFSAVGFHLSNNQKMQEALQVVNLFFIFVCFKLSSTSGAFVNMAMLLLLFFFATNGKVVCYFFPGYFQLLSLPSILGFWWSPKY